MLLIDDETRTYWDHITGEAVHGELKSKRLASWPIEMTNVRGALKREPDLRLTRSRPGLYPRLSMAFMRTLAPLLEGRLYPGFRRTMGEPDARVPEMELGLGVISADIRRFYPYALIREADRALKDPLDRRTLTIRIDDDDQVPVATWESGERPLQMFTRWYGFAYSYPNCEVYGMKGAS